MFIIQSRDDFLNNDRHSNTYKTNTNDVVKIKSNFDNAIIDRMFRESIDIYRQAWQCKRRFSCSKLFFMTSICEILMNKIEQNFVSVWIIRFRNFEWEIEWIDSSIEYLFVVWFSIDVVFVFDTIFFVIVVDVCWRIAY